MVGACDEFVNTREGGKAGGWGVGGEGGEERGVSAEGGVSALTAERSLAEPPPHRCPTTTQRR